MSQKIIRSALDAPSRRPVVKMNLRFPAWARQQKTRFASSFLNKQDNYSAFSLGVVNVETACGKSLGAALFNEKSSSTLRLLNVDSKSGITKAFFRQRLEDAQSWRSSVISETSYRVVNSSGDGLPGIILDRFGGVFVLQVLTAGWEDSLAALVSAIEEVFTPQVIVLRRDNHIRALEKLPILPAEIVSGAFPDNGTPTVEIMELGVTFKRDCLTDGKGTPWLLGCRGVKGESLGYLRRARHVLDVHGSSLWGVQAAAAGAKKVTVVANGQENFVEEAARLSFVSPKVKIEGQSLRSVAKKWAASGQLFDAVLISPQPSKSMEKPKLLDQLATTVHDVLPLLAPGATLHVMWMHMQPVSAEDVMAAVNKGRCRRLNFALNEMPGKKTAETPVETDGDAVNDHEDANQPEMQVHEVHEASNSDSAPQQQHPAPPISLVSHIVAGGADHPAPVEDGPPLGQVSGFVFRVSPCMWTANP